ncbi:uncharacterized protein LOC111061337 [Nilaparvata lugens]|uniref:uncharacterized protein LOC111061337 n=1 Tax=Nilaparvata lugens TaxID=108931 RepID=UPI000B99D133|nr:uncharacterized protein LOC111061337 [Nilaparvata lugens]XP_039289956.1 uncharacterized protein LOC111061337 [Nilaparvata lugens]
MGVLPHLKQAGLFRSPVESTSKSIGFTFLTLRCLAILIVIAWYTVLEEMKPDAGESEKQKEIDHAAKTIIEIILAYKLVVIVILAFFDVMMLIGIYKRRPSFVFAWVVAQVIAVSFAIFVVIGLLIFDGYIGVFPYYTLKAVIAIVVTIYSILVVNSHHTNMKSESTFLANTI